MATGTDPTPFALQDPVAGHNEAGRAADATRLSASMVGDPTKNAGGIDLLRPANASRDPFDAKTMTMTIFP
jgi:hypothetical protein